MKSNQPISQYETEIEVLDAKPGQKLRLYLMLDIGYLLYPALDTV